MSALEPVLIPDLGDIEKAEVIELPIKAGDVVKQDDVLMVLESDKASMEVVAPRDGTLSELYIKEGDSVTSGQQVAALLLLGAEVQEAKASASNTDAVVIDEPAKAAVTPSSPVTSMPEVTPVASPAAGAVSSATATELVPDLGDLESASVVELSVAVGDRVNEGDPLVVLESDKASMEVPATHAGTVAKIVVQVGDYVKTGSPVVTLNLDGSGVDVAASSILSASLSAVNSAVPSEVVSSNQPEISRTPAPAPVAQPSQQTLLAVAVKGDFPPANVSSSVHAGPAVRRLANALHVDLSQVAGSGPRGRVLKEDVHGHVKHKMKALAQAPVSPSGSTLATPLPDIDFNQWGETEEQTLSRIQKISAQHLHRSWTALPHVTQFEEADISELEAFRQSQKDIYAKKGIKLTPLAFIMKACALTLAVHSKFKASLKPDGVTLVYKSYCHMGFACETPGGLVVPVVRDVDKKSISCLAQEIVALSEKARDKRLKPEDMKGAVFSVSSLGGIGGTAFTPIINWPEVAILGVSKNAVKPVWNGKTFEPRTCVPLSLSYDHRVIDGADAARFTTTLKSFLEDLRQWTL